MLPSTGSCQPRSSTVSPRWETSTLIAVISTSRGSARRSEASTARRAPAANPATAAAMPTESRIRGLEKTKATAARLPRKAIAAPGEAR